MWYDQFTFDEIYTPLTTVLGLIGYIKLSAHYK